MAQVSKNHRVSQTNPGRFWQTNQMQAILFCSAENMLNLVINLSSAFLFVRPSRRARATRNHL